MIDVDKNNSLRVRNPGDPREVTLDRRTQKLHEFLEKGEDHLPRTIANGSSFQSIIALPNKRQFMCTPDGR